MSDVSVWTANFQQPKYPDVLASLSACIVTFSSPSIVTRSPQKGLSFRSTFFFRNFRMLRRYSLLNMYYRVQQPGSPMHWKEPQYIFTHGMILREKAFPFGGDCNSLRCCFLSNRLWRAEPPLGGKRPGWHTPYEHDNIISKSFFFHLGNKSTSFWAGQES